MNELEPIQDSFGYIAKEPLEMVLEFPISPDYHPLWGPNIIQAWLDQGWIVDGQMYTDYQTNKFIVHLRKL